MADQQPPLIRDIKLLMNAGLVDGCNSKPSRLPEWVWLKYLDLKMELVPGYRRRILLALEYIRDNPNKALGVFNA